MNDNAFAHDVSTTTDIFTASDSNLFQRVMAMRGGSSGCMVRRLASFDKADTGLFETVRSNIVQSIRAFRVPELADEARRLDQHFLYANCVEAQTKIEVLETISTSFLFQKRLVKSFHTLSNCLTNLLHQAGPQPGFVIVLKGLPAVKRFDKDTRETLLDVFREAAEFWAERKIAFRVFYSFA